LVTGYQFPIYSKYATVRDSIILAHVSRAVADLAFDMHMAARIGLNIDGFGLDDLIK